MRAKKKKKKKKTAWIERAASTTCISRVNNSLEKSLRCNICKVVNSQQGYMVMDLRFNCLYLHMYNHISSICSISKCADRYDIMVPRT